MFARRWATELSTAIISFAKGRSAETEASASSTAAAALIEITTRLAEFLTLCKVHAQLTSAPVSLGNGVHNLIHIFRRHADIAAFFVNLDLAQRALRQVGTAINSPGNLPWRHLVHRAQIEEHPGESLSVAVESWSLRTISATGVITRRTAIAIVTEVAAIALRSAFLPRTVFGNFLALA